MSVLRSILAASVVLASLAVPVGIAAAATPETVSSSAVQALAATPVAIDLYRAGDFVSQTNLLQCVGASMQMMLNIIRASDDTTAATQLALFQLARSLRDPTVPSNPAWRGASAAGWASGLGITGGGPYAVRSEPTLEAALSRAATAMTATGRPVGLLVWQGAHAWVLTGFEASGDPVLDPAARVNAVRVLDPLYPRQVGAPWGPGPAPDARLTVAQLGRVFVPYRPHGRNLAIRNRFVLVLPVALAPAASVRSLPG